MQTWRRLGRKVGVQMLDEKYTVFKSEDFDRVYPDMVTEAGNDSLAGYDLENFVVIRLQDTFAPPALHAYASTIQTAIEIIHATGLNESHYETVQRMGRIRDYFFEKAQQSEQMQRKIPD